MRHLKEDEVIVFCEKLGTVRSVHLPMHCEFLHVGHLEIVSRLRVLSSLGLQHALPHSHVELAKYF